MLDNDGVTYSHPKRPTIPVNNRQSERALITVDRSQKLDLLIHLLTNLQQSLIVCGPEGIGKSTLLKTLESSQQDIWPIVILPGSPALSFESVVNQLSRFLNLSNASVTFDLSALRAFCDKQTVVLAIDDAGELMPGLIGELMDFADSLAGLRLIFALSNDDLAAKSGSDGAINACHFVELPPLNQRQCLEFLQNVSAHPGAALAFAAINDDLVEDLYLRTQGVPGKLLAELPNFQNYQSKQHWKLTLWAGIAAALVSAAFAAKYWWPADVSETAIVTESDQIVANVELAQPELIIPADTQVLVDENIVPAGELLPDSRLAESLPSVADLPIADAASVAATPEPAPAETGELSATSITATADETAQPEPALIEQKASTPATTTPEAKAPEVVKPHMQPAELKQVVEKPAEQPKPVTAPVASEKPKSTKTEPDTASPDPDIAWIMDQPSDHYTVQVMVLSSKASVTRLKRKYAQYSDDLKAYPIGKAGQEKYVIIYGSFSSAVEALNTKSDMPSDFTSGLVKRFKQVQRQSRRK